MSRANERDTDPPPPEDLAGEVEAAGALVDDFASGRRSLREEGEKLLEDCLEGLFGPRKPAASSSGPKLTVHNGGKCQS